MQLCRPDIENPFRPGRGPPAGLSDEEVFGRETEAAAYIGSMAYRLVFFDLDGTLADSAEDISASLARVLAAERLPPVSYEKTRASIGSGVRKLIERCIPGVTEERRDELLKMFLEDYGAHLVDHTVLYPGVAKALRSLEDVTKVVITNKLASLSNRLLESLGILDCFWKVFGGDSLAKRKPDPLAITICRGKQGVPQAECLMVGDSVVDVETADAAGIDVVALTYGYHHPGDLDPARLQVDHFGDVVPIIRKGGAG